MSNMFKPVDTTLPVETNFWTRCKAFWLQDAEAFLAQEITWQKIHDFLFQEITFGKKKDQQVNPSNEEQE